MRAELITLRSLIFQKSSIGTATHFSTHDKNQKWESTEMTAMRPTSLLPLTIANPKKAAPPMTVHCERLQQCTASHSSRLTALRVIDVSINTGVVQLKRNRFIANEKVAIEPSEFANHLEDGLRSPYM